jgi:hypothetical protein
MKQGTITIAFGSDRYIEFARSLCRSHRRHWPKLPIALVTDRDEASLRKEFDYVIELDPSLGYGLQQKLNLERYTPFDQTMFLDADCLIAGVPEKVWSPVSGTPFATFGSGSFSGKWFGADISAVRGMLGIDGAIPRFNGGMMYWDMGLGGDAVFAEARRFLPLYRSLGFQAFRRNLPEADEPLISLGMASCGFAAVDDRGEGMQTPLGMSGRMCIDVLVGRCEFKKEGRTVRPAVTHFCGPHGGVGYYARESMKLRLSASSVPLSDKSIRFLCVMAFGHATFFDHSYFWNAARCIKRVVSRIRMNARSVIRLRGSK